MAEKDAKTKEYMSDNTRFADVFNYYIYGGAQVIDARSLHELDTAVLALPYGEEGASAPIQKYRDVLKYLSAMYDDRAAYLLLGIENQSNAHYAMPVRAMLYDAGQYAKQVEAAAAVHRKAKSPKSHDSHAVSPDEFLGGFYKGDTLLPVITLVIYWSPNEWHAPRSLHEMFSVQDEAVLALVPDYKINLIAPCQMTDADFVKFQTTLAEAFQYIKYSKDDVALERLIESNPKFHTLDRRTAELINTVTGSELKFESGKEVVDMCVAIQDMKKKAETKTLLTSIKSLMETLNLSKEQAMAALKIPEDEREAYAKQL